VTKQSSKHRRGGCYRFLLGEIYTHLERVPKVGSRDRDRVAKERRKGKRRREG